MKPRILVKSFVWPGRLAAAWLSVVLFTIPPALSHEADSGATLEALKARVERNVRELERLRGRKLKHAVPVAMQSEADFRKYVARELARQLPDDLAVKESLALQAFGLLPPGYDLKQGIMELYVSQAGAYYDPETDTFYILKRDLSQEQLDTLFLHELAHAMQDQYHNLDSLRDEALQNANEDARATLAYVYEGEASYLMVLAQLLRGGKRIEDIPLTQQEMVFQQMRNLSREAMLRNALSSRPAGEETNDVEKAVEAMAKVPGYLFWGLQQPYLKGQYCIHRVRIAQGWAGVDALFTHPPTSTEQVLHPEKLVAPREEPRTVTLPDLSGPLGQGWSEVFRNTLGEAGIFAFFDTHNPGVASQAAAGWGGDRYVVFKHPAQGLLLYWDTVWDTEKEAEEFQRAMDAVDADTLCAGRKETVLHVQRSGDRIIVVAGPLEVAAKVLETATPGAAKVLGTATPE